MKKVIVAGVALMLVGCAGKQLRNTEGEASVNKTLPFSVNDSLLEDEKNVVYFEYDSAELTEAGKNRLVASVVEAQGKAITIEGHCDERGTEEYNLALGERRALVVKNYVKMLGAKNVKTISYGENKPADPGHTEEAWSRNRRAVFKY